MAEVIPFAGLLYEPEVALGQAGAEASSLLAPPYDVISEAGRKELAGESPFQSVHLILPQPPQGQASDARYAAARATLVAWQKAGVMSRDERPSFYRYHQVFAAPGDTSGDKIVRKGFVARIRLHRFSEGVILPHERTLSGPKADRLKLKRATRTHLSQVFGLYDDPERKADAAFAALEAQPPALHGTTQDGVSHKLWKLFDEAAIEQVQQVLRDKRIYIADGHHRYETMLALREELRQEPDYCGLDSSVEYGSIFLCNVRDPGLFVFPTHRVLHSLPEFSLLDLLAKLAPFFRIEEVPEPTAAQGKEALRTRGEQAMCFLLLSGGRAFYLSLLPMADLSVLPGPKVLHSLDVTVLHALILEQALHIDRAAQEAQTYLRYVKDNEQARVASKEKDVQAVFVMNPTRVDQVMAVSEAGEVMPQKSTYFYPKIASGLVLNPLVPAESVKRAKSS
ncbi:MAG TPA: DUF1015 domain-containing protein [Pseudomonadota bacterium]|nr:DUF1015 domain-containing protein [Pseudomonadota bacterium]